MKACSGGGIDKKLLLRGLRIRKAVLHVEEIYVGPPGVVGIAIGGNVGEGNLTGVVRGTFAGWRCRDGEGAQLRLTETSVEIPCFGIVTP